MKLGILGPLLVVGDDGGEIRVAAARQRMLLASLLVYANRMVPVDELVEIVWNGDPPVAASRTVRSYVMRLRQAVGSRVASRIVTREPGYLCQVDEEELDWLRFEALCRKGDEAMQARTWRQASASLGGALALWRGAPLADIPSPILYRACAQQLGEARLHALQQRIEADLHLGRHEQLIAELRSLVEANPLHEHTHGQLMLALYRSGRVAEALETFRRVRRRLVDELGVEPGSHLQDLHQRILTNDPGLIEQPSPYLPVTVGRFNGHTESASRPGK